MRKKLSLKAPRARNVTYFKKMVPGDLDNIPQEAWLFAIRLLKTYWLGIRHIAGTLLELEW